MLHGVLEGEDTPLGLGLIADISILLTHTDHHTLVAGAANDGGEDGAGRIVAGEAGLAHAGAVVDDQSGNILVTHGCCGLEWLLRTHTQRLILRMGMAIEVG